MASCQGSESTLVASNLIFDTGDTDMREAQRYLCVAARLLQSCADRKRGIVARLANDTPWSFWLAERVGPPLFALILVLLRCGRRDILQRAAQDIEGMGQPSEAWPAQPEYLQA